MAAGVRLPLEGTVFLSVRDADKAGLREIAESLSGMGFELIATRGTAERLREQGIKCGMVYKVNEGHPHIADRIRLGECNLVINTPLGRASMYDERAIRSRALERGVACITTLEGARAACDAIRALRETTFEVESLQAIHGMPARREELPEKEQAERPWIDRFRPFIKGETSRSSARHQGGT
jgi:carbamoyl-phosphate synthase large subunit